MEGYGVATVSKDDSDRIIVAFQYDPLRVEKVKAVPSGKRHKDKKYWSFPDTNGILEKILEVFKGEELQTDPTLQAKLSGSPIRQNPTLTKPSPQSPSLVKRGEGRFSDKKLSILTPSVHSGTLRTSKQQDE